MKRLQDLMYILMYMVCIKIKHPASYPQVRQMEAQENQVIKSKQLLAQSLSHLEVV